MLETNQSTEKTNLTWNEDPPQNFQAADLVNGRIHLRTKKQLNLSQKKENTHGKSLIQTFSSNYIVRVFSHLF